MNKHLEIRLDVTLVDGMTDEDWKEYRDVLLSKLRAAHHWHGKNNVNVKRLKVYESNQRQDVITETEFDY